MSFFKKLFGLGSNDNSASGDDKPLETVIYEGFEIRSLAMKDGGQYRVCADLRKEISGEVKTHKLIRADMCATPEEASEIAMRKAKQMIKEQGNRLFD